MSLVGIRQVFGTSDLWSQGYVSRHVRCTTSSLQRHNPAALQAKRTKAQALYSMSPELLTHPTGLSHVSSGCPGRRVMAL